MSNDEKRQIQGELLLQIAEVDSSLSCVSSRLMGWAKVLQSSAGIVNSAVHGP